MQQRSIAICLMTLAVFGNVPQGRASETSNIGVIPEELRKAARPIELSVFVPQDGMRVQYVPELNPRPWVNEGLIGNMIQRALNGQAKKAAITRGKVFAPGMGDLNVSELALRATRDAFSCIPWLKVGGIQTIEATQETASIRRASLIFEYAIDPAFHRVFAGCTLHITRPREATDSKEKTPKPADVTIYQGINQSAIDVVGLPSDKRARLAYFAQSQEMHLKSYLTDAMIRCATLAARGTEFGSAEVQALRTRKMTTITTQDNTQFQGWLIEGQENLVDGIFGPFGIKKTFIRAGTRGTLIWDAAPAAGLMELRTVQANQVQIP